jgi:hypothetical protein
MIRNRLPKEGYNFRRRRVRRTLIEWGIPEKLVRKIINPPHKLGDIEKIVQAVKKRQAENLGKYFLKGLNYYREKAGFKPLYRSLTIDKKGSDKEIQEILSN